MYAEDDGKQQGKDNELRPLRTGNVVDISDSPGVPVSTPVTVPAVVAVSGRLDKDKV